jgi:2-keto-4-pentenoate hydratase
MGWKIALASPAMQQMTGLPAPIMGRLHQEQLVHSPAITHAADYGRLIVEFEVAVRLGRNLPARSRPYDAQSVAPAVAAMAPALELADDRNADYSLLAGRGLVLIAENAWNQGAVLGEWRDDWARLPHESLRGEAFINGDCVGSGSSADLMGAPLKALAWLANEAIAQGECMRAGEIAILGSMVTSKFPVAGDRIEYRLQGFEPVLLALG